jgi:hypothetical protein
MGIEDFGQGLHILRIQFGDVVSFVQILFLIIQFCEPVDLDLPGKLLAEVDASQKVTGAVEEGA